MFTKELDSCSMWMMWLLKRLFGKLQGLSLFQSHKLWILKPLI